MQQPTAQGFSCRVKLERWQHSERWVLVLRSRCPRQVMPQAYKAEDRGRSRLTLARRTCKSTASAANYCCTTHWPQAITPLHAQAALISSSKPTNHQPKRSPHHPSLSPIRNKVSHERIPSAVTACMPKPPQPPDSVPLSTFRSGRPPSSLLPPDHPRDAETSTAGSSSDLVHLSQDTSRQPSPFYELPHPDQYKSRADLGAHEEEDDDSDFAWGDGAADDDTDVEEAMPSDLRPPSHRPMNSQAHAPLLSGDKQTGYEQPTSPALNRRRSSRFRERDPEEMAKSATRKRYTYAACFLGLSLVTFAIQTETAVYIQHNLHWNKAYCML